ncbi:hypothetical protein Tco_1154372 [Tanacetum coccineum]
MAGLLFNMYKGDWFRVLLVRELGEMLQALGETMLQDKQGLLNVTIVRVLDEEHLAFLADPRITDGQDTQPTIIHNAAFQTYDLDTYDSDCDDIYSTKAVLMDNLSSYGSDVLSENKCALKQEINSLKQTLSKQVKEKESLLQTFNVLKKESKEKENKNMDKEL